MTDYLKILRDQVLFVTGYFSIFGIIMTDAYYGYFGLRYQFLNLGATHVLYRGLGLLIYDPKFWIVDVLILSNVALIDAGYAVKFYGIVVSGRTISYIFLLLVFGFGCIIAYVAGSTSARQDLYPETTSLRRLVFFKSKEGGKQAAVDELVKSKALVLLALDQAIFLVLTPPLRESSPKVELFRIGVSSDDVYTTIPVQ